MIIINKRLGDLIFKEKLISKNDLNEMIKSDFLSHDTLIDKGMVCEDALLNLYNKYYGFDFIEISSQPIEDEVLKFIPKEMALKYSLMPLYIKSNKLCIVISNPLNEIAINDIRFKANKELTLYLATKEEILSSIYIHYHRGIEKRAISELQEKYKIVNLDSVEENKKTEDLDNAPIVKITNSIINDAIIRKVSDIHFEPFKEYIVLRFRIDGVLHEIMKLPLSLYTSLISRIKIMANLNITERRLPQDGKIQFEFNKNSYDFRVSSLPTLFGEKIVIRILNKCESLFSIDLFNSNSNNLDISRVLNGVSGMILITGPTGSGKSTTLFSMLSSINNNEKNITTIEDPVEYTINGITQINVNNRIGLTFAKGLKSILRQDPDVIMLGEIRDEETAEIAVRAAITGHLVLSTLHTRDSFACISRLKDMGIAHYLLADAIDIVIAQRLIRKICEHCKFKYEATEVESNIIKDSKVKYLFKGRGCNYCNNSGYFGRTIVYELIYFDNNIRKIVQSNGNTEEIKNYCLSKGMVTLNKNCIAMVINGISTIEEYIKNGYSDD